MINQTVPALLVIFGSSSLTAAPLTPVLDGYAYELSADVIIDINNHVITIESNMQNCQQTGGEPPIDTALYALFSNNQFIGLQQITYNTMTDTLFFSSETSDLTCDNGVYVDTIYAGDFE